MWHCASCEYINDDWDESCLRCGVDRVTSEAEHARSAELAAEAQAAQASAAPAELSALEKSILAAAASAEVEVQPASLKPAAVPIGEKRKKAQTIASELQQDLDRSAEALLASELAYSRARESADKPAKRGNDVAAVLIIAICLLGLSAVTYVAWSRGLIKLPQPKPPSQLDFVKLGLESTPAYPANAVLQTLLADTDRNTRPLRPHAQLLFDCQAAFERILTNLGTGAADQAGLSHELDVAGNTARLLLEDYTDFEEQTLLRNRKLDQEKITSLREEYAARAQQMMAILQLGYLQTDDIGHSAFLFSDNIPQVFGKYGRIDASGYAAQWQDTRELRHQQELDIQFAAEIEELQAWYSTLATLHSQVEKVISGLGEISSNRGRLNPAAVKLVVLLDDYAYKIEGFNTDFENYADTLPDTGSNTVRDLLAEFRALALEDHLYCFGTIYQRYAEDRYAELEQYDHLMEHYDYAVQWWPKSKYDYEGVYTKYETRWKELWKSR
jgi:hypothetical protein